MNGWYILYVNRLLARSLRYVRNCIYNLILFLKQCLHFDFLCVLFTFFTLFHLQYMCMFCKYIDKKRNRKIKVYAFQFLCTFLQQKQKINFLTNYIWHLYQIRIIHINFLLLKIDYIRNKT